MTDARPSTATFGSRRGAATAVLVALLLQSLAAGLLPGSALAATAPRLDTGFASRGVLRIATTLRADMQFEAVHARPDGSVVVLQRRTGSGRDTIKLRRFRANGREVAGWGGSFQAAERATRWHLRSTSAGGLLAFGTVDSTYRTTTSHVTSLARFDADGQLAAGFGTQGVMDALPNQRSMGETDAPISEPLPVLGGWVAPAGEGVAYLGAADGADATSRSFVVGLLDASGEPVRAFGTGAGFARLDPPATTLTRAWAVSVAARADGTLLVSMCGRRGTRTVGALVQLASDGLPDAAFGTRGWARTEVCGPVFPRDNGTALVASGLGHEVVTARGHSIRLRGAAGFAGETSQSCSTCPTALAFRRGGLLVTRHTFGARVEGSGPSRRFVPRPGSLELVDLRGRSTVSAPFSPMLAGAESDPFGGASYELLGVSSLGTRAWVAGWYRDAAGGRHRAFLARFRVG